MKDRQIIFGLMLASTVVFSTIKVYNNGRLDQEAVDNFKKEVSSAFDTAEKNIIKVVPNTPVAKCECNGTKEIIHGDGHRTPCPCPAGQCKCIKAQEVAVAPAKDKSIVLYTRPDCIYCKVWKSEEMPKFLAEGWKITEATASQGSVPTIEYKIDGQTKLKTGYARLSEVKKLLNE